VVDGCISLYSGCKPWGRLLSTAPACLFTDRGFVLPTSIFGFVFVARRPEFEIPVFGCAVIVLGLFSLFCYVRELERMGRAFITV
jgi:hypothetical protein